MAVLCPAKAIMHAMPILEIDGACHLKGKMISF